MPLNPIHAYSAQIYIRWLLEDFVRPFFCLLLEFFSERVEFDKDYHNELHGDLNSLFSLYITPELKTGIVKFFLILRHSD